MKKTAVLLFGLLSTSALGQPANINPQPNDVWTFYGPTLGAGWGSPTLGSSILNMYSATLYGNCDWTSKPTGVPNDISTCVQAAHDAVAARGGGTVVVPGGRYGFLNNGIVYADGVWIVGAGGAIRNVCATRIEAIAGFTGKMFSADHVAGIGLQHMCIDGAGRASKVLELLSVGMYDNNGLFLDDATEVVLDIGIGPSDIQPTNLSSFTNSYIRTNNSNFANATACQIGDYDLSLPNRTNDVNSTTYSNFTCISRDGWNFDLRGADSGRFFNVRFDSTGDGNTIFRAGLVSTPGSGNLMGWARYNTFIGASFGGGGRGRLIVEGTDCRSEHTASIAAASWSGTGSITAATLTMASVVGYMAIGSKVSGTGVNPDTIITSQISGATGGVGEYGLSEGRQNVPSTTISGTFGTMTVTATASGDDPKLEDRVYGGPVLAGTKVTEVLSASTYAVGKTQTVASQALIVGTCPLNLDPRASKDNMIYAFGKGGGQPAPQMNVGSDLFCQANNTGGNCGNDMSPWLNWKSVAPVIPKTANYTIVARDCGTSFNNQGATGTTIFTLPEVPVANLLCKLTFTKRSGSDQLTITPSTTSVFRGPAGTTAAGESLFTRTNWASVTFVIENNTWTIQAFTGPWFNSNANGKSPVGGWIGLGNDVSTAGNGSLTFTSLPSAAKAAKLECSGIIQANDNTNAYVQVGTGATPSWVAADYAYDVTTRNTAGAGVGASSTTDANGFRINGGTGIDSAAVSPLQFSFTIGNIGSATGRKPAFWNGTYTNNTPVTEGSQGMGEWLDACTAGACLPITAIRYIPQAGVVTTGGQCSLQVLVP